MKFATKILLFFLFVNIFVIANPFYSQNISGTINQYTNVTAIQVNNVTVSNAASFNVGDKVLLIQMKGASITTGNVSTFGNITNYNSAGKFEFLIIATKNGNSLTFSSSICNSYLVSGLVQLVRVPVYGNATITGTLTGTAWNGSIGGVIALEASNLIFNANINGTGLGFRGGTLTNSFFACGDLNYANGVANAGRKGEGITVAPNGQEANRAPLANGGGGSNSGNPGAGGGGNGGSGGRGGNEFSGSCAPNISFGIGGLGLNFSGNRAFLGGGGGGGYRDNGLNATNGSDGGAIVFIICPNINGNNFSIFANGIDINANTDSEGAGGGGAGGTVYLISSNINSNLNIDVSGGNGGNILSTLWSSACHGPGGGGGGGTVVFSSAAAPANTTTNISGGNAGTILHPGTPCSGTTFNATNGQSGQILFNYQFPIPGLPPDLGADLTICSGDSVTISTSTVYTNYIWNDGSTNPTLTVSNTGYYWVDAPTGCGTLRDSIYIDNFSSNFSLGPDFSICPNSIATVSVGNNFLSQTWNTGEITPTIQVSQADTISVEIIDQNNCSLQDTLIVNIFTIPESIQTASICLGDNFTFNGNTYNQSGTYTITLTGSNGCDSLATLELTVNPIPIFNINDTAICVGESITIQPSSGLNYTWSPGVVTDINGNATLSPTQTSTYSIIGTDMNNCNSAPLVFTLTVFQVPEASFNFSPINPSENNAQITLNNTSEGGIQFTWVIDGNSFIDNNDEIPYLLPAQEGDYPIILTAYSGDGCVSQAFGSVSVLNDFSVFIPNTFTPDGNEFNNVFIPIFSNTNSLYYYHLTIFNRWGETTFETFDPQMGWDGSYNNKMCKEGTYTYLIEFVENLDQTKQIKGHINLVR